MKEMDYTKYVLNVREWVIYILLYSAILFSGGMVFLRNPMYAIPLLLLVPLLVQSRKSILQNKRDKLIRNQFCDALQIISVSLSTGKNVSKAFIDAAPELEMLYGNKKEIIVKEFYIIAGKISMNQSLIEALKNFSSRCNCDEIESFCEAEEICRQTGGNITEIVRNTYQTILQKNEMEDDIDAICSEQKMSFKILSAMPFIIIFIMRISSPDYANLIFTLKGLFFTAIALIIILFAYLSGISILRDRLKNIKLNDKVFLGKFLVLDQMIDSLLAVIRRYSWEREVRLVFAELYDNDSEIYYKNHRKKQVFYLGLSILFFAVCFILICIFMTFKVEILVIFVAVIIGIFVISDREMINKAKKRRKIIGDELPAFLSKLAILTDAGITIKSAIEIITVKMKEGELKKQLIILTRDFKCGTGDAVGFELFASRCRTKGTSSFATLVVQNLRKGGKEFSSILRIYVKTSWERKKSEAKIAGEERSMKLMFPTMLIFIGLMILMATPAVISMNII